VHLVDAFLIAPLFGLMKQQTERLALATAPVLGRFESQPRYRGQFGRNGLAAAFELKLLANPLRKIRTSHLIERHRSDLCLPAAQAKSLTRFGTRLRTNSANHRTGANFSPRKRMVNSNSLPNLRFVAAGAFDWR